MWPLLKDRSSLKYCPFLLFPSPGDGSADPGREALPAGVCQRLLCGRPCHCDRPGQGGVCGEGGGRIHASECVHCTAKQEVGSKFDARKTPSKVMKELLPFLDLWYHIYIYIYI